MRLTCHQIRYDTLCSLAINLFCRDHILERTTEGISYFVQISKLLLYTIILMDLKANDGKFGFWPILDTKKKSKKTWKPLIRGPFKSRVDWNDNFFFFFKDLTCLTLYPAFALVSMNITFSSLAFRSPSSVETCEENYHMKNLHRNLHIYSLTASHLLHIVSSFSASLNEPNT